MSEREELPRERRTACRAFLVTVLALALGCGFSALLVRQVLWPALRAAWDEVRAPGP